MKKALWNVAFLLSLTLLFAEILCPALNRSLWYDDLDGQMLGELALSNKGMIDTQHALPIDNKIVNDDGQTGVYQPGWIGFNALFQQTGLGLSSLKALCVFFWVLALGLYSYFKLDGAWRLIPCGFAFFSHDLFRDIATTRSYNLSAVFFCTGCLSLLYKKHWLYWLSLICLWQTNIVTCAAFVCISLVWHTLHFKALSQRTLRIGLHVVLGIIAITWQMHYFNQVPVSLSVEASWQSRLATSFLTINSGLVPLVLLIPILYGPGQRHIANIPSRVLLPLLLLIFPLMHSGFRSLWIVAMAPVMLVDFAACARTLQTKWACLIIPLAMFTHAFDLPLNKLINPQPPEHFYDPIHYSDELLRRTPLVAWFEARHRKWTRDDASTTHIIDHHQKGDRILYEHSRLSVMARAYHQAGIEVTGDRGQEPVAPFWALSAYDIDLSEDETVQIKQQVERLSAYGQVTVHRIPTRNTDWVRRDKYPPPVQKTLSNLVVYEVR